MYVYIKNIKVFTSIFINSYFIFKLYFIYIFCQCFRVFVFLFCVSESVAAHLLTALVGMGKKPPNNQVFFCSSIISHR